MPIKFKCIIVLKLFVLKNITLLVFYWSIQYCIKKMRWIKSSALTKHYRSFVLRVVRHYTHVCYICG